MSVPPVPAKHLVKWGVVLGALAAYNLYADRNEEDADTLSETVRYTFRTDTVAGKVALCAVWGTITGLALPHWCRVPDNTKGAIH